MDDKTMEMLRKILENQMTMTIRLENIEEKVQNNTVSLGTMKEDLQNNTVSLGTLREDLQNNTVSLGTLKDDVHKNALMLETMQKNIKIIVEVQHNHMAQSERRDEEIVKHIEAKTSLLESILKRVSTDLEELKEDKKSTDEILGRHEVAIKSLRRRFI